MKWMKAGYAEGSADSPERSAAPFGVWRSEGLHRTVQVEGLAMLPALPHPPVQGSAPREIVPAPERGLQNPAQDDRPPIRIHKEGLLG